MHRLLFAAAGLAVAAAVGCGGGESTSCQPAGSGAPGWMICDLDQDVEVLALNDRGQIAAVDLGVGKPFLLKERKVVFLLGPGDHGVANALNDRGQAVGWHERVSRSEQAAFLWRDGKLTQLEFSPVNNDAFGVNNVGQVVGASSDEYDLDDEGTAPRCASEVVYGGRLNRPRAWLWEKGKFIEIGSLGGEVSAACGINDRGQVVGWSTTAQGRVHAFLWRKGRMTDLGTLPGGKTSSAQAVNDRGQVVGSADTAAKDEFGTPIEHAFLWQNGRLRDLGTVPGGGNFAASGINERGQVVGSSRIASGERRAFLWQDGKMTDLGTLPDGQTSDAVDINDRDQIVGWSTTKNGQRHAVLWTLRSG